MTDFTDGLVIGLIIGMASLTVGIMVFHPDPWYVDCGCGAASQMCMQCINGGNLSASVCGAFTGVRI